MLIRIFHTCVALKHKKTDLPLETSAEINFEFIKFVKKIINCLHLTKINREYNLFGNLRFMMIFDKLILPNQVEISARCSYHFQPIIFSD